MKTNTVTALTVLAAIVAIVTPIVFSVHLARSQGLEAEAGHAMQFAREVVQRTDDLADQLELAVTALSAIGGEDGCTAEHLDMMRRIDLASTYIQAIGHVVGDRLLCSSLSGVAAQPIDLGPVDHVSTRGARIRSSVTFPFSGDRRYVVVERDGFATILLQDRALETTSAGENVSLGVFTLGNGAVVASRGVVRPDWLARIGDAPHGSFTDDGFVVAVVKSQRYLIAGVAATPLAGVEARSRSIAWTLVPVGLLAGLGLAAAVFHLSRIQQELPAAIRSALKRQEFFLEYQPIVDLQTGDWVGAEALLRWERPGGERVPPDVFIPLAEQTGQIGLVTARVIELLAIDLHELFARHPRFRIALNLSARDLHSDETLVRLKGLTERTGAQAGNLVVEVTEHSLVDPDRAGKVIAALRAEGLTLAIDDFGTGYSELSMLERLQVDYLKIDRSFVDTLATEAATSHVVPHIIEMARSLSLAMVAEGVETETQAQYLRERGVQFAQGWLYGRSMPFDQLMHCLQGPTTPEPAGTRSA